MNIEIRKNLLDLKYNKYLQFYNTSMIILFSYILGLLISFLTNSIMYQNLLLVSGVSIIIFSIILHLMIRFKRKLRIIPRQIANL